MVAVDWGTSSLRGALLDADGAVIEERPFSRGIMTVAPGEFPAVFEACFGDWLARSSGLCLVSGMAGSRQGWMEAPYCACPAGFAEVADQLAWIAAPPRGWRIAMVPGLSCEHTCAGLPAVPDVMRGEEVQIFGAMQLAGLRDGIFVLPGTHSKWATVQHGRITGFRTFMTGEVYALLSQHSILSRTIAADAPFDDAAFAQGLAQAQGQDQGNSGLLHHAFSARTLSLFGRMEAGPLASYLSGLVIGEELRANTASTLHANTEVVLIGSANLTRRYAQALGHQGVASRALGSEATWAGLRALAQAIT
ncbi:2-dehydro-3-deoxygalactonokinase [Rhodoferax koreense]|uniref:2-dehydro-3-deoxygalactonokinase n=1 Tax=Rhodoferax koreensis TaxID=1842727 RepID=A0A1P8K3V2_9BURK|nr:2-dehydro-3-deoxygalactonokinase [Rhodoferax koreense]